MSDSVPDPSTLDEFGDLTIPFDVRIRPILPDKLRELFVCDYDSDGSADHGHTLCYFASMAADEIERLRGPEVVRALAIAEAVDTAVDHGYGVKICGDWFASTKPLIAALRAYRAEDQS